ncbi:MFS transporter [Agrobacterium rosae]|uniref:Arabinose efflux permease n=1 Tax=Agrobacterium rosae TaxID=1972867 RepID=A0A1R3TL47_9HYPH|nr:MFS transporter [Agrobacterium rosae]MBN7805879.1 MFS transporter [Agrobacterium rosae]SCX06269.1 Arabinose efflux permease [Agrobacterium rosae]
MTSNDHMSAGRALALGLGGALAMASAMGFGRFSFTPILPGMMADVPLSAGQAGVIAAGNFAGYLAGAILAAYSWGAGRERLIALSGLLSTAFLLFAMAAFSSVEAFTIIRFLSGVASALTMIFTSQIVIGHAAKAGKDHVQALHFGGVGAGIAISSLLVFLIGVVFDAGVASWREEWIAGGVFTLLSLAFVWRILPDGPPRMAQTKAEPPIRWHMPLALVTLAYGLFGFGYVITATFIVTIARMAAAGAMVEFLAWFVTGCAAAVSLFVWKPVLRAVGLKRAFVIALAVEAVGILASVTLPPVFGVLVGGLFLGLTFMVITAYGLQLGREFSAESPRRAFAFMTAAFGTGQIIGPLVAGWVAQMTGSFTAPTILAVIVLACSISLMVPVLRRSHS